MIGAGEFRFVHSRTPKEQVSRRQFETKLSGQRTVTLTHLWKDSDGRRRSNTLRHQDRVQAIKPAIFCIKIVLYFTIRIVSSLGMHKKSH